MEETLTITPARRGTIASSAAWVVQTTPRILTSTRSLALSSGIFTSGPAQPRPALLTRTSTRSKSRRAEATKERASARRDTSTRLVVTCGEPAARQRWATDWRRSRRRAQSASRAPLAAKASAVASPIPLEAPVIRTTLFLSRMARKRVEAGPRGLAPPQGKAAALAGDRRPSPLLDGAPRLAAAQEVAGELEVGLQRAPHLLRGGLGLQAQAGLVALAVAALHRRHVGESLVVGHPGGIAHPHRHVVDQLLGAGDGLPRVVHEHRLQLGDPGLVGADVARREGPHLELRAGAPRSDGANDDGDQENDRDGYHDHPQDAVHKLDDLPEIAPDKGQKSDRNSITIRSFPGGLKSRDAVAASIESP